LEAPPASVNHVGKLYLSEEAWEEKWKLREGSGGSESSSRGGGGGGRGAYRGRGNGGDDCDSSGSSPPGSGKVGRDQCRKKGHWAYDCRSKLKKEAAYAAQEEESLILITATPRIKPQQTPAAGADKVDMVAHVVHLREEKVLAQLGEVEHDSKSWICNTGATNHMSGSRAVFTELDAAVCSTARFGDDSVAEIEGRGSVVFICKNGERRSFARVYFIPRLMANIVSVGQLDEAGYNIHIKNVRMDIREPGGRLLARVQRKENMLYVLDINVAQRANCLATRADMEARRWHARLGTSKCRSCRGWRTRC
jgi:hypothetical protein